MRPANAFAFAFGAALALAPAAARAAGGEEPAGFPFWEWVNLLLLAGALFYFARRPVSTFLADRRSGIERDLQQAEELLRQAESRLGEWNARVARLETEIGEIEQTTRRSAEQEAARIVADARATAERICRDAASAVEREGQRAQRRLRHETAELAVAAAEKILADRIQPSDGDRLFDEFLSEIERASAPGARG